MTDNVIEKTARERTPGGSQVNFPGSGDITTVGISAVIEEIFPQDGNAVVYSHAGPLAGGEAGTGIMALRARIRNASDFAIRLTELRIDLLAESGGLLAPAGPQILFAASQIGAAGVTDVFGQTDTDGPSFSAGQTRSLHLQKIQNGRCQNVFFEHGTVDRVRLSFRFAAGGLEEDVVVVRDVQPATHDNGTETGTYLYPMKARDLRPGEFWSGSSGTNNSHHKGNERFAFDTGCQFLDADGGAPSGLMPGTNGANNLDFRYFARPVYAMADGVVTAVRRNSHDNLPGCKTDVPGANKVEIRHGNEIARYLHLMRWSIDPALEVGTEVRAGQYLGLGGNSGSSTAPHLHVDVLDADTRTLRPLHFRDVYTQGVDNSDPSLSNADWLELNGNSLPAAGTSAEVDKVMLWPSRERPRDLARGVDSSDTEDATADHQAVGLGPNVIVTATRMAANNRLRLFSYEVDGNAIVRQSDSGNQAGAVQDHAAVEASSGLIAVATQTSGGRHEIIVWERSADGTLTRVSDSGNQAGNADLPRVVGLGGGRIVSAFRTQEGKEKLAAWHVTSAEVERLGSGAPSPEDIDRLALSSAGGSGVISCSRSAQSGRLRLRLWDVSDDGNTLVQIADSGAQGWSIEQCSVLGFGSDLFVTATRDESCSRLNLTAWEVEGNVIRPVGDAGSQGDKIGSDVSLSLSDLGNECFAVGLADAQGRASLSVWCVERDYRSVTLLGHSGTQMGDAGLLTATSTTGDRIICTAITDSSKQKLIEFTH